MPCPAEQPGEEFATGRESGTSAIPRAIREAFHSRNVTTIARIRSRIRSASSMWLPRKRSGFSTLRMKNAIAMPTTTSVAKTSEMNANHEVCPRIGKDDVLVDDRDRGFGDRREQHDEAPEDERVHQTGAELLEELLLEEDVGELAADAVGGGGAASGGPSVRDERHARPDAPHEQDDRHDDDGREGRGGYEPVRRFSISSVRAGTTLKRSPTTPRSAIFRIGASGSFVIATIRLAPFMPTRCWRAPLIPAQM